MVLFSYKIASKHVFKLEICTGAVTGTNPRVSAGIPREREQILRKTRGNNGNGNDFCGNTAGTGPNFTGNTTGIRNDFRNTNSVHCDS